MIRSDADDMRAAFFTQHLTIAIADANTVCTIAFGSFAGGKEKVDTPSELQWEKTSPYEIEKDARAWWVFGGEDQVPGIRYLR